MRPDQPLYIYEVQGLGPEEEPVDPDCLGCWVEGEWGFLFFTHPAGEVVQELIARRPGLTLRAEHHLTYGQWQAGRELTVLRVGGLVVAPVGAVIARKPDEAVVWLDPGLVFGTGLHPTTRLCLELLVEVCQAGPVESVLDLGCGTGVLALAAARLGARRVTAVDLNPLCVRTTRDNVARNQLGRVIDVARGDAADWVSRPAQVVAANLTADVLLAVFAPASLAGKRAVIVSGFLASRAGQVRRHFEASGLDLRRELTAEGWTAQFLVRPD